MALIGQYNSLRVVRAAPPGYYLDGGSHGEILLPGCYIPPSLMPGHTIEVFVCRDSEDRLVATTERPYAVVGEFAFLRVVGVNPRVGVFFDWGLEKDLLLPRREQIAPLQVGDWLVVRVALDQKSDRIFASARLPRWLDRDMPKNAEGQRVRLLVIGETPLGYKVIVEHALIGLLYRTDLADPLTVGQPLEGFVRAPRFDGRLDVALDRAGFHRIAPLTEQILQSLDRAGGRLPFHDDSTPLEIRTAFGVSKKAFKQALGALYRERRIRIEAHGIRVAKVAAAVAKPTGAV
jgi:predicted RNA-binding protein (virulence factor B family)